MRPTTCWCGRKLQVRRHATGQQLFCPEHLGGYTREEPRRCGDCAMPMPYEGRCKTEAVRRDDPACPAWTPRVVGFWNVPGEAERTR